jgi:hypothetical protein
MISNARAESDARSARVGDRGEGTSNYGDERDKVACLPSGDSEGEGNYDDEYDTAPRHALQHGMPKRESI